VTKVCRFCDKPLRADNARVVVTDDVHEHMDRGDCIAILQARTESLRAAVRAADAAFDLIFDGADGTEAHDAYREARAKCGDVT